MNTERLHEGSAGRTEWLGGDKTIRLEQHPDLVAEMVLDDLFELGVSHAPALSHGQSNPGLATVGKLDASGFENLTNAGDGAGAYFFASLEANDCLGSNPRCGR